MRVLNTIYTIVRLGAAVFLVWILSCRDAPRDNPFDPQTEVLQVTVDSPADSSVFRHGEPVRFSAGAITAFDGQAAAVKAARWRSSLAGFLSDSLAFTLDSLPAGAHRITVTLEDSSGRSGSRTFLLTVLPTPLFGVLITMPPADTAVILGSSFRPVVEEYVAPGSTVEGRLWSFGPGSGIPDFPGRDPGTVTWNTAGKFPLIYQIVDSRGRTAADTLEVDVVENATPPYVVIVSPVSDTTLAVGDSLFLEALEIETSAKISVRSWTYPPGSGLESRHDTKASAGWRHFMRTGEFEIVYSVRDKLGQSAADTVSVAVIDTIPPPQATILAPSRDTTVARGAPVIFSATDLDPWVTIAFRNWDWDPASGLDNAADTTRTPAAKIFMTSGTFRVSYTVRRANGAFGADTVQVTVRPNQLPVAQITSISGDTSLPSGVRIPLAGSGTDPDNDVASLAWSLLWPDGIVRPVDFSESPTYFRLAAAGVYRLYFRVTDTGGAQSTDSLSITVLAGAPDIPPLAKILIPHADTTVGAWAPVSFLGQDSDPDGSVESRQWDFGAGSGMNAAADTTTAVGPKLFTIAGNFPVVYRVIDNRGVSAADTLNLKVLANNRPAAEILVPLGNITTAVGDTLFFIALDSDLDGRIASRQWNYGLNSGIDASADTLASVSAYRYFLNPGVYIVTYTVKDNLGAVRADSVRVTVIP